MEKRDFFDFDNKIYRPLWVRLLILAVCFGFGLWELSTSSIGWALIFLAAGAWCFWGFFIRKAGE